MFTQERTPMSDLVVGGPVPVNSYDNAIVAALIENRPVMLVHAFNVWLVLTSAIEWILIGLALRAVLRRLSK